MQDVCLFAHFDQDDKVDDYVFWYLSKLKALDFSIIFISASRISGEDVARLRVDCHDIILRENVGLDFGSWAEGLRKHGSSIRGRLLLANDSVYGPIRDLKEAFDRLTCEKADFYGMVESRQIAPHLQSWFLLFEPWVHCRQGFKQFFEQRFPAMGKQQIILTGEVALSQQLLALGLRYKALHSMPITVSAHLHVLNPAHLLWRELLCVAGVPFLKIELMRDNPMGLEDASTILKLVKSIEPAMGPLIEAHHRRTVNQYDRLHPAVEFYRRQFYRMMRKDYVLSIEHRWTALTWNTIKLEIFTLPLWPWLIFKKIFYQKDSPNRSTPFTRGNSPA